MGYKQSNFKQSEYIGGLAEKSLISLLENCGLKCHKSKGRNEKYDIGSEIQNQDKDMVLWECKLDLMSEKTQNLAIEYYNPLSNKPSGLMSTLADMWVFAFKNPLELWYCTVQELKSYLEQNSPKRVVQVGGDSNASLLLYSRDLLCETLFQRLDNLDSAQILRILNDYVLRRAEEYLKS